MLKINLIGKILKLEKLDNVIVVRIDDKEKGRSKSNDLSSLLLEVQSALPAYLFDDEKNSVLKRVINWYVSLK